MSLNIAQSCKTTDCELFRDGNNMVCYVGTRADHCAKLEFGDINYIKAEVVARALGFTPKWGV